MSYLNEPMVIPWASLQDQFGADFTRTRKFKEKFLTQLKSVLAVYPQARVAVSEEKGTRGLKLEPSPTHVGRARLLSP
jgi:hypothetical protein